MTSRGKYTLVIRFAVPTRLFDDPASPWAKNVQGKQAAVGEERVRQPVGGHPGEPAEEDREDHHRHEGLQDRPGGAERGLLVAHLDVAPDQEVEQLAVLPELPELEAGETPPRFDHQNGEFVRAA